MSDNTKQGPAALAWSAWKDGTGTLDMQDILRGMNAADAAIAELEAENETAYQDGFRAAQRQAGHDIGQAEAENERLKVCGNCASWYGERGSCIGDASDSCHFTPPRWTERGTL